MIMERFAVEQARKAKWNEEKFMERENRRQELFGHATTYFDDINTLMSTSDINTDFGSTSSITTEPTITTKKVSGRKKTKPNPKTSSSTQNTVEPALSGSSSTDMQT
jgi:predicted membrane protein